VVRGQVLNGAQGIAGEWGHNILDPDGEPCYCGKTGCVETVLSGPALERYYESISGKKQGLSDISATTEEDPFAKQTIDRLVSEFGRAAAVLVNILDPDVLVLGGGVGNVPALYEGAIEAMKPWVFNDTVRTQVVRPTLGDSAGVFGAAMLAAS
jgi:predicted NBD/HSP70 family sugar kinase